MLDTEIKNANEGKEAWVKMKVVQINWEEKKELVESCEIDCIMGCFFYGRTS